tara:strand:- start:62 stop:421 length:360 start_codon:yes stop_codon:yes gene_type:complete
VSRVKVEVIGLSKAISDIEAYMFRKKHALLGVVAEASKNVTSTAKQIVPVDTGNLRTNISYTVIERKDKIEGEIIADTDYASYVELGTSKMRAQPYMLPSAMSEKPKFVNACRRVMSTP